jgi:hypothetical protein
MFESLRIIRRPSFRLGFQVLNPTVDELALVLLWVLDLGYWQLARYNPDLLDILDAVTHDPEATPATITPRPKPKAGKE